MSKISIEGNASGTGTLTIAAPNTNTNRTLNLPDSSGTVVVTGGAQTIEFAAGTVSAPSITTTGDTNTGIYFPTADTIGFTEGGAEAMRINSSGLVSTTASFSSGGYIVGGQYYRSSGMVNETVTVTTEAFVYSMNKDQGAGGSSATSTYNITGIPNADGSFAIIFVRNANTAAGINCTTIVQIHGNEVWRGGVQNNTKTASFTVFRTDGTWRTTQWGTGAAFSNVW